MKTLTIIQIRDDFFDEFPIAIKKYNYVIGIIITEEKYKKEFGGLPEQIRMVTKLEGGEIIQELPITIKSYDNVVGVFISKEQYEEKFEKLPEPVKVIPGRCHGCNKEFIRHEADITDPENQIVGSPSTCICYDCFAKGITHQSLGLDIEACAPKPEPFKQKAQPVRDFTLKNVPKICPKHGGTILGNEYTCGCKLKPGKSKEETKYVK